MHGESRMAADGLMMDRDTMRPRDYLAALKRRKWHVILPTITLSLVSVLAAFLWPPVYRSTATILIEEPDVPRDLVRSTITSYADQRIQVIAQRVTTTRNLIGIIDKFDLFAEEREKEPINKLVEKMREDLRLDLVSAEVIDPRSGRPTKATIAFTLAFDHRQPRTAQKVVNELVSLYLGENLRTRQKQAAETTAFLKSEAVKLSDQIADLEAQLASFKRTHAGTLPEQMPVSLQKMERMERQLIETRRQMQVLEERRIYLEAELAQLDPYRHQVEADDQRVMSPEEKLQSLEIELIGLRGVYGPDHPDVVRLAREIEAFQAETGVHADPEFLEKQLETVRLELAVARQTYAEDHPDVVKLNRRLESLQTALEAAGASDRETASKRSNSKKGPDNPVYVQIRAQLEAVYSEARALKAEQEILTRRLADLERQSLRAPEVEREYRRLQRDYENAITKYETVKTRQIEAELGEALEEESKSESFTLIEPPIFPQEPVKPNRTSILFLGLVFSVAVGVGLAILAETMDEAVYGAGQLAAITGAPPLVVVPYIENRADIRRRWLFWTLGLLGVAVTTSLVVGAVHEYVRPLDVLWAMVERRLAWF